MAKGDDTQMFKLVRIVVAFIIKGPAILVEDGPIRQAVQAALLQLGAVGKTGPRLVGLMEEELMEEELSSWTKHMELAKGDGSEWVKLFKTWVAIDTAEGEQSDKIMQAVFGPIEQSVCVAQPQVGAVSKTKPRIVCYMEGD